MGEVFSLVGAQWGSEGKGVIAAALAREFDAAVRVGGPNAGHSFWFDGRKWVARSVPCAWINPDTVLVFGAGGVLNPEQLVEEIEALPDWVEIEVDGRAACIVPEYEHRELETIRGAIGSTAEGVGLARQAKMARDGSAVLAADYDWAAHTNRVKVADTWRTIRDVLEADGTRVFLEGTQGSGLSLDHGTKYPFATSSDTNVSGLFSAAGIAPDWSEHVHLVARTFPIRVAGNSGPMGKETTWEALGVAPEITTVTKKVRRVSEWDDEVFEKAVWLNQPCGVWLTFIDYIDPDLTGCRDAETVLSSTKAVDFINHIERDFDVPVVGVSTGGDGWACVNIASCAHDEYWPTVFTKDANAAGMTRR